MLTWEMAPESTGVVTVGCATHNHLKAEHRIDVSLESLRFGVLDRLLQSGETYFAKVEAAKIAYRKQRAEEPKRSASRKHKGEGRRETDPWPA